MHGGREQQSQLPKPQNAQDKRQIETLIQEYYKSLYSRKVGRETAEAETGHFPRIEDEQWIVMNRKVTREEYIPSFLCHPNTNTNLFFFDIEFEESELSFRKFGLDSLPHICIVPPLAMDLGKDPIEEGFFALKMESGKASSQIHEG
nr:probable dolichyl-diphosphooligosaccharide--protein glycosyltransferase subunit 3B [Ipomoea trifida]